MVIKVSLETCSQESCDLSWEVQTGDKKFIFCYDPARSFDGSILSIYQLIKDKKIGYYLRLENCISMVDINTKNKTPLPMPEQLEIIKEQLIRYNGVGVP